MQVIVAHSDDDVVIIDGKSMKISYIKAASRCYEQTKARSKRYKQRLKQKQESDGSDQPNPSDVSDQEGLPK